MKMIQMAAAALIAATLLIPHTAFAQQPGIKRTDLQRHDLSVPGREMSQVLVEFAAGAAFPKHSHPGEEIATSSKVRSNTHSTIGRRSR
jgi:quercetin dioxygenase-like cupin family protein